MPAGRSIYVPGYRHEGEPIMLTEFGGITPSRKIKTAGAILSKTKTRFYGNTRVFWRPSANRSRFGGFCYTQLTDVFQEKNGLLTFDRRPKVAPRKSND